jgi:hypothetical protein
MRISIKSRAFERRFFSLKSIAPQINETTTDERRIIDTTDIIASLWLSAVRYARSAAESRIDIIGIAHDKKGKKYYIAKNSWGKDNPYGGLIYMSEDYVRMKTIAVWMIKE